MSDIKLFFAVVSVIVVAAAFIPYFRDIVARKTQPHAYTWLIWSITQGIAAAVAWFGGGGRGVLSIALGALFVMVVFLFSLRYGTKNITFTDTVVLIAAIGAILVWWQLDQPVLAVLIVSLIDMLGYIPSFRKSYEEPWSETVPTWVGFIIGNITAIVALDKYNTLTLSYLLTLVVANTTLVSICLMRRSYRPRLS